MELLKIVYVKWRIKSEIWGLEYGVWIIKNEEKKTEKEMRKQGDGGWHMETGYGECSI